MDRIIAVRVRIDSGADRYFLTWGRMGSNDPWPGDIERAVLKEAMRWAVGGVPVSATVCDSLQEASKERYFFECLSSMQHAMPPIGDAFWPWADEVCAAVLEGRELYYCGRPEEDRPADPNAKFGFILDCFDKSGALVSETDLPGVTIERAQAILDDDDIDRVMCLSHVVGGDALARLVEGATVDIDETRFDYFLTRWADGGFRTPRGYFPPPRILSAFPDAVRPEPSGAAQADPAVPDEPARDE